MREKFYICVLQDYCLLDVTLQSLIETDQCVRGPAASTFTVYSTSFYSEDVNASTQEVRRVQCQRMLLTDNI